MLRILIADDHDTVWLGLRHILGSHPDWEVVAEAGDGKDAISMSLQTKPDVAVLDYSMPLINGVEATRQIRERLPKTEVLIFSIHDEEVVITELLKAGARAYVLKSDFKCNLINAVESLAGRYRRRSPSLGTPTLAAHKPFLPASSLRPCSMLS